jgi:hypothetical protein
MPVLLQDEAAVAAWLGRGSSEQQHLQDTEQQDSQQQQQQEEGGGSQVHAEAAAAAAAGAGKASAFKLVNQVSSNNTNAARRAVKLYCCVYVWCSVLKAGSLHESAAVIAHAAVVR